MTSIQDKTALVIGGSSGVGKVTVKALISSGVRVTAVARGAERLNALRSELGDRVSIRAGDASDPDVADAIMREVRPDLLVLAAGITPQMGTLEKFEWESFSETWNTDLKSTFHFVKLALTLPLAPGSTVVIVSSGAAINGSPLSGGYAGAKRMQWLLAGYAQKQSDAKELGIRIVAILPSQLIEGTAIGQRAAEAYGQMNGISAEAFMKRFAAPLHAETVASAIVGALRGEIDAGITALGVNAAGVHSLS